MRTIIFLSLLIITIVGTPKTTTCAPSMEIGSNWILEVSLYSRDWMLAPSSSKVKQVPANPEVQHTYEIKIEIIAIDTIDGATAWKFKLAPSSDAPKGVVGHICYVWLLTKDSAVVKIEQVGDIEIGNPVIRRNNGITYIENAPYGFPIDIFSFRNGENVENNSKKLGNDKKEVKMTEKKENEHTVTEIDILEGKKSVMKIRKVWDKDKNQWVVYEKYSYGHKELSAKIK